MLKPSLAEPVSLLRRVPIRECGEEMVDFLALCPLLTLDHDRFNYRRATVLRKTVAEKLCIAATSLPDGYRLGIVEGWRAPHIQRRMYLAVWKQFQTRHPDWSPVQLKRVVNRYTAPLDARVPPPHTTGGAVDVVLLDADGKACDVTSPYTYFDPAGFAFAAPKLSDEARRNREILGSAMVGAGITNYPSEYWHYSYGDQGWAYRGWAYRGSLEAAIYGGVTPVGWSPDPAEVSEEPLTFLNEGY